MLDDAPDDVGAPLLFTNQCGKDLLKEIGRDVGILYDPEIGELVAETLH